MKIVTIGKYKDSIVNDYFKDNENIEFLELGLNENIEKFKNSLSSFDIVFLRGNEENLEKILEVGKKLKEKEIISVTILDEKTVMENKEILENSINAIFPISEKSGIENLLLELLKMFNNILSETCCINLDIEDIKSILKDFGIAIFGALNLNQKVLGEEVVNTVTYPFYNKTIKGSKLILIHLGILEGVGLVAAELIIDTLRNKSGEKIEDIMFSMMIDNSLKNRIECSFIAGSFNK